MTTVPMDYSLYLVTDRGLTRDRELVEVVRAAVNGGVTCVQLREKTCCSREFIEVARQLKTILAPADIPLIINDRLDVALAVGADGVHLGQKDIPLELAREIVGDRMVLGISVESLGDAVPAEQGGADYLGVSPIYSTPTKTDTAPPLGLEGLRRIRQAVKIPLVGIGGVNSSNAARIMQSGADGVAVVSALMAAPDPEGAARELWLNIKGAGDQSGRCSWG